MHIIWDFFCHRQCFLNIIIYKFAFLIMFENVGITTAARTATTAMTITSSTIVKPLRLFFIFLSPYSIGAGLDITSDNQACPPSFMSFMMLNKRIFYCTWQIHLRLHWIFVTVMVLLSGSYVKTGLNLSSGFSSS